MRLTNLQDYQNTTVNLEEVIEAYWKEANRKNSITYDKFEITEMSLSGNMPWSEMINRKLKWKTFENK